MKNIYLTGAVVIDNKTGESLYAGSHNVSDELAAKLAENPRVKLSDDKPREDKSVTPTTSQPRIENK